MLSATDYRCETINLKLSLSQYTGAAATVIESIFASMREAFPTVSNPELGGRFAFLASKLAALNLPNVFNNLRHYFLQKQLAYELALVFLWGMKVFWALPDASALIYLSGEVLYSTIITQTVFGSMVYWLPHGVPLGKKL